MNYSAYLGESLEGINTIIYGSLDVIHDVVCGSADHNGRHGTLFTLCQTEKTYFLNFFFQLLKFYLAHVIWSKITYTFSTLYSGVWQNDWETRPPPGNYSTTSDTWIQASPNKMPSPEYAWSRSNTCHCDVIMSQLWLWSSWRPHKFAVSESPVHFLISCLMW